MGKGNPEAWFALNTLPFYGRKQWANASWNKMATLSYRLSWLEPGKAACLESCCEFKLTLISPKAYRGFSSIFTVLFALQPCPFPSDCLILLIVTHSILLSSLWLRSMHYHNRPTTTSTSEARRCMHFIFHSFLQHRCLHKKLPMFLISKFCLEDYFSNRFVGIILNLFIAWFTGQNKMPIIVINNPIAKYCKWGDENYIEMCSSQ